VWEKGRDTRAPRRKREKLKEKRVKMAVWRQDKGRYEIRIREKLKRGGYEEEGPVKEWRKKIREKIRGEKFEA